jgi:hypothetical protein
MVYAGTSILLKIQVSHAVWSDKAVLLARAEQNGSGDDVISMTP